MPAASAMAREVQQDPTMGPLRLPMADMTRNAIAIPLTIGNARHQPPYRVRVGTLAAPPVQAPIEGLLMAMHDTGAVATLSMRRSRGLAAQQNSAYTVLQMCVVNMTEAHTCPVKPCAHQAEHGRAQSTSTSGLVRPRNEFIVLPVIQSAGSLPVAIGLAIGKMW